MVTIEKIYLQMVRLMNDEGMSKEQAQQEALESERIDSEDWTQEHQKALDERFAKHDEAVQRERDMERSEETDAFNPDNMEG